VGVDEFFVSSLSGQRIYIEVPATAEDADFKREFIPEGVGWMMAHGEIVVNREALMSWQVGRVHTCGADNIAEVSVGSLDDEKVKSQLYTR